MRRKLIEALTFPRMHVMRSIDEKHCKQDGFFCANNPDCDICDIAKPCHWLSCHEVFSDLAKKPVHTIHASLLYCIEFMSEFNAQQRHNALACTCENCSWVREARRLSREYSNTKTENYNVGKDQSFSASVF